MTARKVLVVDDSPTDLIKIKSIVRDTGCMVLTAANGREAIELANAENPDVIFLDIIMPDMDGYEACRKLTKDTNTKHIPVVFVTSKDQKADLVWAKMQGGKDLVTKPYTAEEIVSQINAV